MGLSCVAVFLLHLLLCTISDAKHCFVPAVCDGKSDWIHFDESRLEDTCQKSPGNNQDKEQKFLTARAETLQKNFEYLKSLMNAYEESVCSNDVTIQSSTVESLTTERTIAPDCRNQLIEKNCREVCDNVINGIKPDSPIGFASRGAEAKIFPDFLDGKGVTVYCDCTNGSEVAWTVFQRRIDGSVDFYRNWTEYTNGFGNISGEFWLGLEFLNKFTGSGDYKLRIDLADWEGNTAYAEYSSFTIGNSSTNYTLIIDGYSGNAGDSLAACSISSERNANLMPFSTFDRDNDNASYSCAQARNGAWWFDNCFCAHLNGRYYATTPVSSWSDGIHWREWRALKYSLKSVEMKMRG